MRVSPAWIIACCFSWQNHLPKELAGEEPVVNPGIVDAPGADASRIPQEAGGR
jgi:hypothetical protein